MRRTLVSDSARFGTAGSKQTIKAWLVCLQQHSQLARIEGSQISWAKPLVGALGCIRIEDHERGRAAFKRHLLVCQLALCDRLLQVRRGLLGQRVRIIL